MAVIKFTATLTGGVQISGPCSGPKPVLPPPALSCSCWVAENHILPCPLPLCEALPVGGMMSPVLGVGENWKPQPEERTIVRVKQTEGGCLLQAYWFPLVGSFLQAPEVWIPAPWGNASLSPSFSSPRRHRSLLSPSVSYLGAPLLPFWSSDAFVTDCPLY